MRNGSAESGGGLEPLDIPDAELCRRYEALYTGAVNDVLRQEGLLRQTLPHAIVPLRETMTLAGIAFTVKGAKHTTTDGEMEQRVAMLAAIKPNNVVVWDTTQDDESAHWGEVMTKAAIRAGCRGAVIDGGVRDTGLVLAQNFPVFCRYRSSNGMLGRFRMIDFERSIRIGEVDVHPGDVIFGDIDGVLVIPRRLACDVLVRAEKIRAEEQLYKQWLDEGVSADEVVRRGGYF